MRWIDITCVGDTFKRELCLETGQQRGGSPHRHQWCNCDTEPTVPCPQHGTTYKGMQPEDILHREY